MSKNPQGGNRFRGKVNLTDEYAMKFTTNAFVELEEKTEMDFNSLISGFEAGRLAFKELRLMIWASLLHQHEDDDGNYDFTPKEAGKIIDEVGFTEAVEKMGDALQLYFPDVDEQKAEEAKKKLELQQKAKNQAG